MGVRGGGVGPSPPRPLPRLALWQSNAAELRAEMSIGGVSPDSAEMVLDVQRYVFVRVCARAFGSVIGGAYQCVGGL